MNWCGIPAPAPDKRKPAAAEDLDRLTARLTEVLEKSGYVHSEGDEAKIRRLVRRMDLAGHDAEIWLGMIRQIEWKLKRNDILRTANDQGPA